MQILMQSKRSGRREAGRGRLQKHWGLSVRTWTSKPLPEKVVKLFN